LNELFEHLSKLLAVHDNEIAKIACIHGANRVGDIPHSLASVQKASQLLGYSPRFNFGSGLKYTADWYWQKFARSKNR